MGWTTGSGAIERQTRDEGEVADIPSEKCQAVNDGGRGDQAIHVAYLIAHGTCQPAAHNGKLSGDIFGHKQNVFPGEED